MSNTFTKHSSYSKYHFTEEIHILVLKCKNCNKHHAVIPSFSLPGTSLGTEEVEKYIKKRKRNKTRREAGEKLLLSGISFKHLSYIEKMFRRAVHRMKSLLPEIGNEYLEGIDWCLNVFQTENPEFSISRLNTYCLDRGINAVFCNRYNILQFRKINPGVIFSNNMGSSGIYDAEIDSS